jgi:hypothetical protein
MSLITSGIGTFRTWRDVRVESTSGGITEVGVRGRQDAWRRRGRSTAGLSISDIGPFVVDNNVPFCQTSQMSA